ncbi:LLM class flavin-dependent oxidoreductase [Paenirhodobacter sp.]|uniref:LLM class flavin-dependent oxidoreductase n=1 Tax=Paenirhodobacter sp. TaxID=1965326 RepID=UPI003B40520F
MEHRHHLGRQCSGAFRAGSPPVHAERYERAHEFLDVVTKLWDSWEDGALIAEADSGIFADDTRIHPVNHAGRHFRVQGARNHSRSPQGRSVYVQAGSSEDGRHFAALHAAIFAAHQIQASAQDFYADINARPGRGSDIKVLPGISPFIAGTEAEAKRLEEEVDAVGLFACAVAVDDRARP